MTLTPQPNLLPPPHAPLLPLPPSGPTDAQTVRALGSALDAFMVRVKELDGVLLHLLKAIDDGLTPPEQLNRLQRLMSDAHALAVVRVGGGA